MTKFERGDVVHITKKWLDEREDPNTDYFVLEDLTDEVFPDGRVKVAVAAPNSILGYYTYVYSYDMVYKVGHVDPEHLED